MVKPRNSFEVLARDAAERLDQARAAGQQLSFLADEAGAPPVDMVDRKAGRPLGAKNKGSSQLREWLAVRGYRMPEDVLAEMAGLASRDCAMLTAMGHADRVLTWAYVGAEGGATPGPEARLAMFAQLYAAQLRAADALMPYGAAKPDVAIQQNVQVVMPAIPVQAHDVTPQVPRISGRMVPADVAYEIEQKQALSDAENDPDRTESRTE